MQGCDLKLSPEDINELFNEIDVERRNKITRSMFVDVTTFILGKLGGGSSIEKSMSKGSLQIRKGMTNTQAVSKVLTKYCDAF